MSTASTPVTFAVWNPPDAAFPIRYPLPLFRDIEFFVGDAYRRIPYGGLEVGAVLYGRGEPSGLTILAYQPIECQHSMGPSFVMSAFDLELLAKQIETPMMNEEGEILEVVGWLVSNCRSQLVLTEQESRIFDEFFPGPRQVTLLAKPEKMKPTRYGFLERPSRGRQFEKACRDSFILPLSNKGEPMSVPERAESVTGPSLAPLYVPPLPSENLSKAIDPRVTAPVIPKPVPSWPLETTPDSPATVSHVPLAEPPAKQSVVPPPEPNPMVAPTSPHPPEVVTAPEELPQKAGESADVTVEEDLPVELRPVVVSMPSPVSSPPAAEISQPEVRPAAVEASPALPVPFRTIEKVIVSPPVRSDARVSLTVPSVSESVDEADEPEIGESRRRRSSRPQAGGLSHVMEIAAMGAIVGLLGFAAFWTYLRIQRTTIPLNAEFHSGQVLVTWPPDATVNASQASITVWTGGQPAVHNLLLGEETEGRATVLVSGPDATIQLQVSHWYGDRTGQIRVARVIPPPPPVPAKPTRRFAPFFRDNVAPPPLVGQPADSPHATPPQ